MVLFKKGHVKHLPLFPYMTAQQILRLHKAFALVIMQKNRK
jgi:hypothetical protein